MAKPTHVRCSGCCEYHCGKVKQQPTDTQIVDWLERNLAWFLHYQQAHKLTENTIRKTVSEILLSEQQPTDNSKVDRDALHHQCYLFTTSMTSKEANDAINKMREILISSSNGAE